MALPHAHPLDIECTVHCLEGDAGHGHRDA